MSTSQYDVIKNFMHSLDVTNLSGTDALDEAVKASSKFKSMQELIDTMISDCNKAESADVFLRDYCGIILDNEDTGAITGSDVGGSTVKNAEDIVPEKGTAVYPSGTSFTKRGIKFIIPEKSTLTTDQQTVVRGLYSWWIDECLKLIEESYGYSFNDTDTTVNEITLMFENKPTSTVLAYVSGTFTSVNNEPFKGSDLSLTVNMGRFDGLSTTDADGKSSSSSIYLDRTIAHELTHAIMMAKINDFPDLPKFITEGMAEVTHGIDDVRKSKIKTLANNPDTLKQFLNLNVNVTDNAGGEYAAGYMFLRYLAKQSSDDTSNVISSDNKVITSGGTYTIDKDFTGTITINTTEAVIIDGEGVAFSDVNIVTSSTTADLTIKDLNINNTFEDVYDSYNLIKFGKGKNNKLRLLGSNKLESNTFYIATVNIGGGLTINGNGSLNVTSGQGGACIGTDSDNKAVIVTLSSNLTIEDDVTINAVARDYGAAIGSSAGGKMGDILINSGTIVATSYYGAAIGSGQSGSVKNITINGGDIETTTNGYGAGIGTGSSGGSVGDINISGETYVTATAKNLGAGIGTGYNGISGSAECTMGTITINGNAQIVAKGSVGIGSENGIVEGITIGGDSLIQAQGSWGAAIGSGSVYGNSKSTVGTILINDRAYVSAISYGGAGIGTGEARKGGYSVSGASSIVDTISIEGDATVTASSVGQEYSSGGVEYKIYSAGIGDGYSDNLSTSKVGTINVSGNTSTNAKSKVTINNSNETIQNIINGITYSGKQLTFTDGVCNESKIIMGSSVADNIANTIIGAMINALGGNDSITNIGSNVTVKAGDGNDSILNYGSHVMIDAGNGNDYIYNSSLGSGISIIGGIGDDSIYNDYNGSDTSIIGGNGNDNIRNFGSNVTIIADAGNDTVYNQGQYAEINLVSGNNSIENQANGKNTSIISSGGNNSIRNLAGSVMISTGGGNNTIDNASFSSNVTIYGSGNDSISNVGINTVIIGSDKKNTIKNWTTSNDISKGSYVSIVAGGSDDSIHNSGSFSTVNGGAGDDNIFNNGSDVIVIGGDGNDTISSKVTANNTQAERVSISGGSGDDKIILGGNAEDITVNAGVGNDTISLNGSASLGHIYQYAEGDGNDVIYGFKDNDTLQITEGTSYTVKSGSDLIVKVGGGSITLKDYSLIEKLISGTANADSIYNSVSSVTIDALGGNDTIRNYGSNVSINAGDGKDCIYNYGSNVSINADDGKDYIYNSGSYTMIDAGAGDDSINNSGANVTINGGAGNDFVTLTGNSTGITVTGDSGDDTIYGDNISHVYQYSDGDGNDLITGFNSSDTLIIDGTTYSTIKSGNHLIVTAGDGSITLKNSASLSSFNIIGTFEDGGNSTIPGGDSDTTSGGSSTIPSDTITIPDGISLKNGTLTVTKNFAGDTIDLTEDWAVDVKKVNLSSISKGLSIIGKDTANSIKGGKGADTISGGAAKDTIYGGSGNDSIFGGEGNDLLKGDAGIDTIDGGTGTNTLTGGAGKDVFIHSEGEDVITDYATGQDKIMVNSITGDSLKGSDIILFTDNGNVTVKGGKNKKITVVDIENNTTTKVYGQYNYSESNTKLALTSGFSGTLNSDDYDSAVEEIDATAITKSGRIYGNDNNNVIIGSARNDSIYGNSGDNTLTGGNGNDVFIHEKGDDYITDYTAGKDKIKLLGVTITSASLDENDLVLQTTNGTITLADAKGTKITVIDAKNKTTTAEYPLFLEGLTYDKKNVLLTATTDFSGETIDLTDYYSTTTKVNANVVKHAIEIYGNDNNNSIKGGKGSDTIYGGAGNDTITGGTGKDIFVYEKGDDVITDYKAGQDKIKVEGSSITGSTIKSSNVILQTDEGTLTIKSGRNKKITVIDSSGNETTKVYGNSSDYETSQLIADDNLFNVEEPTLEEITDTETLTEGVNLRTKTYNEVYVIGDTLIAEEQTYGIDYQNKTLK